jgi:hypothetical protein
MSGPKKAGRSVAAGFEVANVERMRRNQQKLYCMPDDYVTSKQRYFDFLDKTVKILRKADANHPHEVSMLIGSLKGAPCN